MRLGYLVCQLAAIVSSASTLAASEANPGTGPSPVEKVAAHLAAGTEHLLARRYSAAINEFDRALDIEPDSFRAYFQRATAQLSLGRRNLALSDYSSALHIEPNKSGARLQRARLHAGDGDFDSALEDLTSIETVKSDSNDDANSELQKDLPAARELATKIRSAKSAISSAQKARDSANWSECIDHASKALRLASYSADLHVLRGECSLAAGRAEGATTDFARAATLRPTTALELMQTLGLLYFYSLDNFDRATSYLKQCLYSDPEHRGCKRTLRTLKNTKKDIDRVSGYVEKKMWHSSIKGITKPPSADSQSLFQSIQASVDDLIKDRFPGLATASASSSSSPSAKVPKRLAGRLAKLACRAYAGQSKRAETLEWCSLALVELPEDAGSLYRHGEALLEVGDDIDGAVRDLSKAHELTQGHPQNHRIAELLQKALRLQNVRKQRDYYKILGVSRDASQRDIKKAYRSMAQQWHPDTYRGELSAEEVTKKMAEINDAYAVLSDEEKKQQYDMGSDPNDPMGGRGGPGGGGGFPFGHGGGGGGFPFGNGGSFQFVFPGGGGPGGGGGFPFGSQEGSGFRFHFN
ncbi:TPR-like protein [Ramicandelaber brevisporus]|nr:TPR-like protein [Ramicandelaber brevisporus]